MLCGMSFDFITVEALCNMSLDMEAKHTSTSSRCPMRHAHGFDNFFLLKTWMYDLMVWISKPSNQVLLVWSSKLCMDDLVV